MESNKVKGLIFPVGGEAQAFLADRDRPYRDIREAVQGVCTSRTAGNNNNASPIP